MKSSGNNNNNASGSNKRIHSRTVKAKEVALSKDQQEYKHEKALRKQAQRQEFTSLSDQIAESTFWFGNWKFPHADQYYPHDPELRTVQKYYPYARGGALLTDEVWHPQDAAKLEHKKDVLRNLGFRYLVIESESTYESLMEQLGEL